MPDRPKRPCRAPNCPRLSETGYCDQHQQAAPRKAFDKQRGSSWKRGYDAAWNAVRRQALLRDRYLCVECLKHKEGKPGQMVRATDVYHIVPF